jgi:hypothetical protein
MAKILLHKTSSPTESFAETAPLSEAERFMRELGVKYSRRADGMLVAHGDIKLSQRGLEVLPDFSSVIVEGNFLCDHNRLTSLKGAPREANGFWCEHNLLTNLAGAPEKVARHFFCGNNILASLMGSPETLNGVFHCTDNRLGSLVGGPGFAGEKFFCGRNPLATLEGAPQTPKIISDFGDFESFDEIPEHLRLSPETAERLAREKEESLARQREAAAQSATVLQEEVALARPFRLKLSPKR